MKQIVLLFLFLSSQMYAFENWSATADDGHRYELYELLDQGKYVVLHLTETS